MKQAEQKRDLDRGPASQPAGFGQAARGPSKGKERLTRVDGVHWRWGGSQVEEALCIFHPPTATMSLWHQASLDYGSMEPATLPHRSKKKTPGLLVRLEPEGSWQVHSG